MILRKPYALFIKMFKPIHLLLAGLIAYLIFLESKLLSFLSSYIYSSATVIDETVKKSLINNMLFIIPIIVIVVFILILTMMFKKNKPIKFYLFSIFSLVGVLVINLYASNFLGVIVENIVSIKIIKLIHDIVLISVMIESTIFTILIIRGFGINFKKFDFDSDLFKLDISDKDREEIEVNVNINIDEVKRKRNERKRKLKYFYYENKFLINISIVTVVIVISGLTLYLALKEKSRIKIEGKVYDASNFSYGINSTILLNENYKGKKISDNYLVVVNSKMKSNYTSNSLNLNDFSLKIDELIFKPTIKYQNDLNDIGIVYNNKVLTKDFLNYLFVFEIPKKYIKSDMFFRYNDLGYDIDIKLKPRELSNSTINVSNKLNDTISFKDTIGDLNFKINSIDIKKTYAIKYNYCISEGDCYISKEYINPTLNKNFDKAVLKLNIEYKDNSGLNMISFYEFLSTFGEIYYCISDKCYTQNADFEQIKSSKVKESNVEYIGIDSKILNADSIKFIFNIRHASYEYVLK